ncbi:MAG TPA: ATP-binding protein [Gemmatimonadales bacterium]|nr:ATP-binding protein [Gemmatimonadales bacterium]
MTLPAAPAPPLRRWLGLRNLLITIFAAGAIYSALMPLLLIRRVERASTLLAKGSQGVLRLLDDLALRADAAHAAVHLAGAALGRRPDRPLIDSIASLASYAAVPWDTVGVPMLNRDLRAALVLAHDRMVNVARALIDAVGAMRRGLPADADRFVSRADSLALLADEELSLVERLGTEDLRVREMEVAATTAEIHRVLALWLVLGVFLAWLSVITIRRRVLRPLAALEVGLARVSDGDFTTRLPVEREDEVGRLAAHFNQMTRVLRDRAEDQGRFAAAGELLAGVAHEVNNPLMAIAAHMENQLADPDLPREQREENQQVLRQAQRASKLLRGLLRFVRASERNVTSVNLNDVVRGGLDLVSYRFGVDEITVGGRLDPALPPVRGDAIRLEQVVVNLLSNAIDALRTITPPRRVTVDSWVADSKVCVAVTDNGHGVAPPVLEQLFHPFATTKPRGTGLGLYISRQIAREAGGDLVLAAVPKEGGARFVMSLPVGKLPAPRPSEAPVPSPARAAEPSRPAPPPRLAGVRVLVVDDEEPIRRPLTKFLTRRGAQVLEAADGLAALEILAANPVDVILADLRMPKMGGAELFAELERTRPELAARLLFLSGDVSQLAQPGNTPVPRERVFVKPVELTELELRIAEFVRSQGTP